MRRPVAVRRMVVGWGWRGSVHVGVIGAREFAWVVHMPAHSDLL